MYTTVFSGIFSNIPAPICIPNNSVKRTQSKKWKLKIQNRCTFCHLKKLEEDKIGANLKGIF